MVVGGLKDFSVSHTGNLNLTIHIMARIFFYVYGVAEDSQDETDCTILKL